MLNSTKLPLDYEMIYVALFIKYREAWQQESYEINGNLYVTLVIEPIELRDTDVAVVAKNKLRKFLSEAVIEEREYEPVIW